MNGHDRLFVGPRDQPDKYRLKRQVGSGGEANLWEAEIDVSGVWEPVAVKILRIDRNAELDGWVTRWAQQAEVLRFIRHPGVVGVREHFVGGAMHLPGETPPEQPNLYLVMNWVPGTTIREWQSTRRPGNDTEVLNYLAQVGDVLDWLHSGQATPSGRPVVHADVTPNNVILSPSGQAVLIDFGLARLTGGIGNAIEGTGGYLAPEVKAAGAYSPASDRYAFGALAYFLLTGTTPPLTLDALREGFRRVHADRNEVATLDELMAIFDPVPTGRPACGEWIRRFGQGEQTLVESGELRPVAPTTVQLEGDPPPTEILSLASPSIPDGNRALPALADRRRRRRIAVGASIVVALAVAAGVVLATRGGSKPSAGSVDSTTSTATGPSTTNPGTSTTTPEPCYTSTRSCAGQNLTGLTLPEAADLHGVDFSKANLAGAHLPKANLDGANLFGANLQGAQMQGARLTNANFQNTDLHGADLTGADLTDAFFLDVNVSGLPTLIGATLPDGAPYAAAKNVAKDPAVQTAQGALNAIGITRKVSEDGLLGPDSERALRAFRLAFDFDNSWDLAQLDSIVFPKQPKLLALGGRWTSASGATATVTGGSLIVTDSAGCIVPYDEVAPIDAATNIVDGTTFKSATSSCHIQSRLTLFIGPATNTIHLNDTPDFGPPDRTITGTYTPIVETWIPVSSDVVAAANGDLTIVATGDTSGAHGAVSTSASCSAIFEVEGREASGKGSWGIAVHSDGGASPSGRELRYDTGSPQGYADLAYPTTTPSHFYVAPTANGWHQLKIVVTNNYFAEWVDGKFIVEGRTTTPCTTNSGFFIDAGSSGTVEVRNIRIVDLSFVAPFPAEQE